jgi:hypothetical protein
VSFSTAEALELADDVLSRPPAKPHIVRPVLRGERVFRFALPLELCKTTNLTRQTHIWEAARRKRAAWERIQVQWFQAGCPKGPLPGRPQVICLRLSTREPDTYSDWAKVAVDMLCPPRGTARHGLGLLEDDRPSLVEVVQYWEPGPRSGGACIVEVRA